MYKQRSAKSDNTENAAALLTEVKTTQFFTDEPVAEENLRKILSAGVNAPSAMNSQPWHFTAVTNEEVTKKLSDAMSSMKPPALKDGKMPSPPEHAKGKKPENAPEKPENAPEKPENAPEKPENAPEKPENAPEKPENAPEKPENAPEKPENAPEKPPKPGKDKADFSKAANKAGIGDAPVTIVISCEEGSELSAGLAVQNMSAEAQLLGYGTKILTSPTMALNGENTPEFKELLNIPENQRVAAVLLIGTAASGEENPDVLSSATTRNSFDDTVTIIG